MELRKLTDTRAGRWLFAAIAAACVVIVVTQLVVLDRGQHSHGEFFFPTLLPVGVLLPVLGILSVTSEWSQRTALGTFALVPVRQRVMVAKLAAAAVATVLSVAAGLAFAALANLAAHALGGGGAWNVTAAAVGNALVFQLVNVVMGVAFGMLLLNSPLAIVLYFLLPTLWSTLGGLVDGLRTAAGWLDLGVTMEPLLSATTPGGGQWARMGTSVALWLVLPLLLGLLRVLRTEIR